MVDLIPHPRPPNGLGCMQGLFPTWNLRESWAKAAATAEVTATEMQQPQRAEDDLPEMAGDSEDKQLSDLGRRRLDASGSRSSEASEGSGILEVRSSWRSTAPAGVRPNRVWKERPRQW